LQAVPPGVKGEEVGAVATMWLFFCSNFNNLPSS